MNKQGPSSLCLREEKHQVIQTHFHIPIASQPSDLSKGSLKIFVCVHIYLHVPVKGETEDSHYVKVGLEGPTR